MHLTFAANGGTVSQERCVRQSGWLVLGLALATVACSHNAALQLEVDEMSRELNDLRRSHAIAAQRMRELDRLGQTTYLIQDSLERLSIEVDQLRAAIEEQATRAQVVEAAVFGNDAGDAPLLAPRDVATAPSSAAPPARALPPANDARGVYQAAYQAMQDGNVDVAVAGFEDLLQRFNDDDLADNAHYWLGEIFISLGDLARAEQHFRTILDRYPGGNKVPDATYKLGTIAQAAGDCEVARAWYGKVTSQFSWSPVAEKVPQRLAECEAGVQRR